MSFRRDFLRVFLPPNYQYGLEEEIKNRVQCENKPVELYVASMMELFARLPEPYSAKREYQIIRGNLRPSLQ